MTHTRHDLKKLLDEATPGKCEIQGRVECAGTAATSIGPPPHCTAIVITERDALAFAALRNCAPRLLELLAECRSELLAARTAYAVHAEKAAVVDVEKLLARIDGGLDEGGE